MTRKTRETIIDAEAKAQLDQEEKRKLLLAKAKILLRDGDFDYDDIQDKRVSLMHEATYFTDMIMNAWKAKSNAQASYRVGKAMLNKATIEAAENTYMEALALEAIADPELRSILPQVPGGWIGVRQEWNTLALLPKKYRDLIGRHLTDAENSTALTLELEGRDGDGAS